MSWLKNVLRRIAMLVRGRQFDREMDEEMRLHRELQERELILAGVAPEEARYAVERQFGNALRLREESRAAWGWLWLEQLLRDMRFGLRMLRKNSGFTAVAVLTLALGIGANTAIFSVVNQVLLNPSGVSDPQRVVAARVHYDKIGLRNGPVSIPDFGDMQKSAQIFESAAILYQNIYSYSNGDAAAEPLSVAFVSEQWFRVFGAQPRLGRVFEPEEDKPNTNHVVVLSYAAWTRLFGRDAKVLGENIELNGMPYRVVGVMEPEFRWPADADLWIPLGLPDAAYNSQNRLNESYTAVARLKPGVSLQQANAFLQLVTDRVKTEQADYATYAKNAEWGMSVMPFTDFIAGDTKTPMLVLTGAVAFVLLLACANIAGLMLGRAATRTREIAIRTAIGASRWDIARQILVESLALAFVGAVLGVGLAYAGAHGLLTLAPQNAAVALRVRIDSAVLFFTAFTALAAGILFGVMPALWLSRGDEFESLKEVGRSATSGAAHQHLRSGLVVAEMTIALVLLTGAGLFLRSLARLEAVSPGFQPTGAVAATVVLPAPLPAQITKMTIQKDAAKNSAFQRAVLDRLSHLPGVTTAAAGMPIPFSGIDDSAIFEIEDHPVAPGEPPAHGDQAWVTPDYFSTLQIPLLGGRTFTDEDQVGSAPVAIIDETLAQQYWPNEDPIGKRLRVGADPWATIVGIVGHVKKSDLAGDTDKGKYYFPMYQTPLPFVAFVVRTQSDPLQVAGAIGRVVHEVNPTQAVWRVETLSDMVGNSLAPRRFVVTLLGIFSVMALFMAVLGLYGVISYSVSQRTREIGIRIACGAQRDQVQLLVIGQGMRLAGIGAAIGLLVSLGLSRIVKGQLFHAGAFDALTFAATAATLIATALVACYIPARRATRIDPAVALRHE